MKRFLILLLCLLLLCGCTAPAGEQLSAVSKDAVEKQTINYYFMTGEGTIVNENHGDYFTKWGDCCLVVFPNGQTMLIDTGIKGAYPVIKAKLESYGITKLDYVVISHPHDDHGGGMWAGLFGDFTIGQVYHNGYRNASWSEKSLVQTYCTNHNIPCDVLTAGDQMTFGDVTMKVLWPTKEAGEVFQAIEGSGAVNCLSLVMRFDYGEHSSLFTGDLYKTYNGLNDENGEQIPGQLGAEEQLVALYPNGELDVDLLKLPHHGDPATSNSTAFFAATSPEMAMATGFTPVGNYLSVYKKRGYKNPTFFDRQYGYVQFFATADGKMKANLERTDYMENFGKDWNMELERKG